MRPRDVHAGENLVAGLGTLPLAALRAAGIRRLAIAGVSRLAILSARRQLLTWREGGNHLVAIMVRVLHSLDEGYRPIRRKRREQTLDAQLLVDELLGVGDAQVLAPAAASVDQAGRVARPCAPSRGAQRRRTSIRAHLRVLPLGALRSRAPAILRVRLVTQPRVIPRASARLPRACLRARAPRVLRARTRLHTRIRFCFFLRVFLTPFLMISHVTHCVTRTPRRRPSLRKPAHTESGWKKAPKQCPQVTPLLQDSFKKATRENAKAGVSYNGA